MSTEPKIVADGQAIVAATALAIALLHEKETEHVSDVALDRARQAHVEVEAKRNALIAHCQCLVHSEQPVRVFRIGSDGKSVFVVTHDISDVHVQVVEIEPDLDAAVAEAMKPRPVR